MPQNMKREDAVHKLGDNVNVRLSWGQKKKASEIFRGSLARGHTPASK